MKLFAPPAVAALLALGSAIPAVLANSQPRFPYDPNTTKYCVWWLDSDGKWTCAMVKTIYGLATEDFLHFVRSDQTEKK